MLVCLQEISFPLCMQLVRTLLLSAISVLFLLSAPLPAAPKPAEPWHKLEGCRLIPNQWNDGDSFHVLHEGNEFIFRLYFVDAPEAETSWPELCRYQALPQW